MKEAIERVITELEKRCADEEHMMRIVARDNEWREHYGRHAELCVAIAKLQVVMDHHD